MGMGILGVGRDEDGGLYIREHDEGTQTFNQQDDSTAHQRHREPV